MNQSILMTYSARWLIAAGYSSGIRFSYVLYSSLKEEATVRAALQMDEDLNLNHLLGDAYVFELREERRLRLRALIIILR